VPKVKATYLMDIDLLDDLRALSRARRTTVSELLRDGARRLLLKLTLDMRPSGPYCEHLCKRREAGSWRD
jgi:hypothetical protein